MILGIKKRIPWNKGKTGIYSEETKRKWSLARKGKKYAPGRVSGMKGKKHKEASKKKTSLALKGHITTAITRKRIGVKNKITGKRFWESMTESQKRKTSQSKTWFKKGQAPHNKGKKPISKTRKRMSASATLRFQTQKHPHQGTHRSEKTKQLLREARIRQKPPKKPTWPERFVAKMLETERIPFEKQKGFRNPYCVFDFYIEPKICIFTDGDYYHCNPKDYIYKKKLYPGFKPNDRYVGKKYAKDKWASDKKITRELRKKGYTVIRIWQSELETDKEKCLQKILKAIK